MTSIEPAPTSSSPTDAALTIPAAIYTKNDSGARAAAEFYSTAAIYFLVTGDSGPFAELTSRDCVDCARALRELTSIRDEGLRYEMKPPGFTGSYTIASKTTSRSQYWVIEVAYPPARITRSDGGVESEPAAELVLGVTTDWSDDRWVVAAVDNLVDET